MNRPFNPNSNPNYPKWPYYWADAAGGLEQRVSQRLDISPGTDGHARGSFNALRAAAGFMLLHSWSDQTGVWFRLYASQADADADDARTVDAEDLPDPAHILVDAYYTSPDALAIRHGNGDAPGVECFNWDNPALPTFYYHVVATATGASYAFPDIHGAPQDLGDFYDDWDYPDPQSRYNVNYSLRPWTGTATPALLTLPPFNHSNLKTYWRGYLQDDAPSWFAKIGLYLGRVSPWDVLLLTGGLERAGSGSVLPTIGWIDAAGTPHTLNAGTPYAKADDWTVAFSFQTRDIGGVRKAILYKAPYSDLTDLTQVAIATVPPQLLIPGHDKGGFFSGRSEVPGSPAAFGGLATTDIIFPGSPLHITLGYVPIERAGGKLILPT